jgi:hypothetical protein
MMSPFNIHLKYMNSLKSDSQCTSHNGPPKIKVTLLQVKHCPLPPTAIPVQVRKQGRTTLQEEQIAIQNGRLQGDVRKNAPFI